MKLLRRSLCLILALLLLPAFSACGKKPTAAEGEGDLTVSRMMAVKDGVMYYVHVPDYCLYSVDLATQESVKISDTPVSQIAKYNGEIYYAAGVESDSETFDYEWRRFVDGTDENDVPFYRSSDELLSPQFNGDYLYFMKADPEVYSGYSNTLYRVALSGGEAELVCDAPLISYYADGADLYLLSPGSTYLFVRCDLEGAVSFTKEHPKAEGEERAIDAFGGDVLMRDMMIYSVRRSGNTLYFAGNDVSSFSQEGPSFFTQDLDSGEIKAVNGGTSAAAFLLAGDYIYYYNYSDSGIFRMNTDGSDVCRVTGAVNGYMAVTGDTFIYLKNTGDLALPSLTVCDLDGTERFDLPIYTDEYAEYLAKAYEDYMANGGENAPLTEEEQAELESLLAESNGEDVPEEAAEEASEEATE